MLLRLSFLLFHYELPPYSLAITRPILFPRFILRSAATPHDISAIEGHYYDEKAYAFYFGDNSRALSLLRHCEIYRLERAHFT